MKHAPSKLSVRNSTRNQNSGMWNEIKHDARSQAIETAKNTPYEIKNTNIKYLLKR